jgi:hypothetical protein
VLITSASEEINHELVNKQGFLIVHTCAVGQSYAQRNPNKSPCSLHTLETLPLFYSVYGHDKFPTDNRLHPNKFCEGYITDSKIRTSEYRCGRIQWFKIIYQIPAVSEVETENLQRVTDKESTLITTKEIGVAGLRITRRYFWWS